MNFEGHTFCLEFTALRSLRQAFQLDYKLKSLRSQQTRTLSSKEANLYSTPRKTLQKVTTFFRLTLRKHARGTLLYWVLLCLHDHIKENAGEESVIEIVYQKQHQEWEEFINTQIENSGSQNSWPRPETSSKSLPMGSRCPIFAERSTRLILDIYSKPVTGYLRCSRKIVSKFSQSIINREWKTRSLSKTVSESKRRNKSTGKSNSRCHIRETALDKLRSLITRKTCSINLWRSRYAICSYNLYYSAYFENMLNQSLKE